MASTLDGQMATPVGRQPRTTGFRGGPIWAWLDRNGRVLRTFVTEATEDLTLPQSDAMLAVQLVACNPDFLEQRVCYGSAVVESFSAEGAHASASLGTAAPEWQVGGVTVEHLPPWAAGQALVVEEEECVSVQGGECTHDPATQSWRARIQIVDESARPCGAPWIASQQGAAGSPLIRAAVDDNLRVLVFKTWLIPFRQSARWFTIDGVPLTEEFAVSIATPDCVPGPTCEDSERPLIALIGGGVVYQSRLRHLAVFPSGEARYEPAPRWLAEMDGRYLYRVGNRGYAFAPAIDARDPTSCARGMELVSLDGTRCGTMELDAGVACPMRLWVGRDGTVFQVPTKDASDPCHWAVWDRLLQ